MTFTVEPDDWRTLFKGDRLKSIRCVGKNTAEVAVNLEFQSGARYKIVSKEGCGITAALVNVTRRSLIVKHVFLRWHADGQVEVHVLASGDRVQFIVYGKSLDPAKPVEYNSFPFHIEFIPEGSP
jgi:hypothetical protein